MYLPIIYSVYMFKEDFAMVDKNDSYTSVRTS